jgi:hypothetical protein
MVKSSVEQSPRTQLGCQTLFSSLCLVSGAVLRGLSHCLCAKGCPICPWNTLHSLLAPPTIYWERGDPLNTAVQLIPLSS